MDSLCEMIQTLAQQPATLALVALSAGGLLLLFGGRSWHPLLMWPLSIALAILAGGPPLCEMVLLRAALGLFATVILLLGRGAPAPSSWRIRLGALAMRTLSGGLAAAAAVSFVQTSGLTPDHPEAWRALAGVGALGAVHALVSRAPRGVATGIIILLMALEGALWLFRPSLLVLAGSSALALMVALAGALHQEVHLADLVEKEA